MRREPKKDGDDWLLWLVLILILIALLSGGTSCTTPPRSPIASCNCSALWRVQADFVRDGVDSRVCFCYAARGICTCPSGTGCACN